jgi:hypothetical protein
MSTTGSEDVGVPLFNAGSVAAGGALNRPAITTTSATQAKDPSTMSHVRFVLSFIEFCLLFLVSVDTL